MISSRYLSKIILYNIFLNRSKKYDGSKKVNLEIDLKFWFCRLIVTSLNLACMPTEFSMSENHVFRIRISMILVRFETWATTIRASTTSRCQNEWFAWGDRGGKWPKLWQRYHGPCTKTAWKLASKVHLCTISLVAMVPSGSISTHTRLTWQRISDSRAIHFRALLQICQSKSRAIILSFATRRIQISFLF